MSDPNYTALLLVIDRSGSMSSIRDDMVGGLTGLLEEQKKQPGLLTLSIVSFDNQVELTHRMADPEGVAIELDPRGSTALYDAVGVGINTLQADIDALPEHAKPSTVQVIVVTDGEENASGEYSGQTIKHLITEKTKTHNWDFVFLGANQDAIMTAAELGIQADSSMTYSPMGAGVTNATSSASRYVSDRRQGRTTGFSPDERRKASGK
jgi:uncharacterized protein YegL